MSAFVVCLVALLGLTSAVNFEQMQKSQRKPGPYTVFKTEPKFVPNAVKVTHKTPNRNLLSPGYIFMAPHLGANGFGPQIIDDDGNLVWYGNLHVVNIRGRRPYAMDLTRCDFHGSIGTHLSWSEGRPNNAADQGLKAGGANRIFNNHYEIVEDELQNMGSLGTPNPHEFHVLPGGETYVQTVYEGKEMDLTPYNGKKKGWVTNGCFQEVDVRERKAIFEWCFLDHFPIWETYMYLHTPANKVNTSSGTSGRGTFGDRWDFMHMNAIDKNEEGDYLVSGRHLSQILKIAGKDSASGEKPGTVLWRVGGKHSDFKIDENAQFGRQHHSRFVSTSQNETLISVFNNADDGVTEPTRDMSAGMIIKLNNVTRKASLHAAYNSPMKKLSFAQGSMHPQPNGNVHVGWGTHPEWSEFSPNGTLLYHAKAYTEQFQTRLTNYRSFKFEWVGLPKTDPKLVAYSQTCNMFKTGLLNSWKKKGEKPKKKTSPLFAYVSWNGATEVKHWRFSVSAEKPDGPWMPAGTHKRDGFETRVELSSDSAINMATFIMFVKVEGLDKDGNILGSTISRTFVPKRSKNISCGVDGCDKPFRFAYLPKFSRAKSCSADVDFIPLFLVFVLVLAMIEMTDRLYNEFMTTRVMKGSKNSTSFYQPLGDRNSIELGLGIEKGG